MTTAYVRSVRLLRGRFWRLAIHGSIYDVEVTLTADQFKALREHLATYYPIPKPPSPIFGEGASSELPF